MEEENFMVSFFAAIIGVLQILFFSIIACERKRSRRASTQSYQKPPTSSKRKPSKSKSSTLKSDKCEECKRFDAQVDAAINSRNDIIFSQTNGGCVINGYEITPKRCEHGNNIVIDRPGLRMSAINGNLVFGGTFVDVTTSDKNEFDQERYMEKQNRKKAKRISKLNEKKAKRDRKMAKRLAKRNKKMEKYNRKMEKYSKKKAALNVSDSENETECESD